MVRSSVLDWQKSDHKEWDGPAWMTSAGRVVTIDSSQAPWVSGEPRGQVTWGRPGAWPYACPGPSNW